jgi:hypothetical protein
MKAEALAKFGFRMTKITQLLASPVIENELFKRIQEHGGRDEVILWAIDRINVADYWHGKKLGIETFLKDTIFPKFLNSEWENYNTNKR